MVGFQVSYNKGFEREGRTSKYFEIVMNEFLGKALAALKGSPLPCCRVENTSHVYC